MKLASDQHSGRREREKWVGRGCGVATFRLFELFLFVVLAHVLHSLITEVICTCDFAPLYDR